MASMALLNCSVLCQSVLCGSVLCRTDNLIFPWKILSIGASGRTVQQFLEESVLTDLKSNQTGMELPKQLELSGAFWGKSRLSRCC